MSKGLCMNMELIDWFGSRILHLKKVFSGEDNFILFICHFLPIDVLRSKIVVQYVCKS